jgi:ATP-dependent Clp protease ATP-binding subunit ClpX
LIAIADRALERNTGARGLRAILEKTMNDIMYEVPSNPKIAKVIVTKECITEGKEPDIVLRKAKRTATTKPSGEAV